MSDTTREGLMSTFDLEDEEFDDFYASMLAMVRQHGTWGVESMLAYISQELDAGRENIE